VSEQSLAVAGVVNPVKVDDLEALKAAVAERSGDVTWYQTTEEDPGAGPAAEAVAAGAKLVLVCGGDGTVAACAGALAGTGVTMAVIPAGTGNLLARNLDLPLELPAALDVAFEGSVRQFDVLEAGDTRFVVMAGLGFDAALIRDTDERLKAKLGWPAYLGGFVRAVQRRRPVRYSISVDDQPAQPARALGVLVGNVGQLQAGITLLPKAVPDDGTLDVIVLKPRRVLDYPLLIMRILRRRAHHGPQADIRQGRQVRIAADRPVPAEFDGDYVGERTELEVKVLPGALLLRCGWQ